MGNDTRDNDEADERARRELADALARVEHDRLSETDPAPPLSSVPPPPPAPQPPPASAAEFRRPARPSAPPGASLPRPAAPAPTPTPSPTARPAPARPPAPAKPGIARPQRPDRPDRPQAPPSTAWSDEEAALVQSHYDPTNGNGCDPTGSQVIHDDAADVVDDAVVVSMPEPAASQSREVATKPLKSVVFRRTVIPILLTCGVLLIGIGLLRWFGGAESTFADMSIPVSATLCGSGMFLLLVAVLNMLQVRAEMGAAARRRM